MIRSTCSALATVRAHEALAHLSRSGFPKCEVKMTAVRLVSRPAGLGLAAADLRC